MGQKYIVFRFMIPIMAIEKDCSWKMTPLSFCLPLSLQPGYDMSYYEFEEREDFDSPILSLLIAVSPIKTVRIL
jgi:hypothetical protein